MLKSVMRYVKSKWNFVIFIAYSILVLYSIIKGMDLLTAFVCLGALCYMGTITFSAKKANFNFTLGCIVFMVAYISSAVFTVHCYDFGAICRLLMSFCLGCLGYLQLRKRYVLEEAK